MGKRSKIIGIIFFICIYLINPLVWVQLAAHSSIFGLILFALGLCYYYQIFGVGRRLVRDFQYLEDHNRWAVIVVQAVIFILYLLVGKNLLSYKLHSGLGDEPSYTYFDFSTWTSILGNHRTAGLPVILKGYGLLFKDLYLWPHFQMISYILSVFFLYWCFLRFGFNKLLAILFISVLLWDRANYMMFRDVRTEPFAAIFLNLSVGIMFLAIRKWSWKTALPLGLTVFWLYQIRANFAFVPLLIPLWAAGVSVIFNGYDWIRVRTILLRFSLVTLVPLFLFCFLRLAVVGEFGVVSMSGGMLAGHATHYLNETNIVHLSGDVRKLADEILVRKRQLSPPNNLSPFEWVRVATEPQKIEMQAQAYGPDLITAWAVAIKQLRGQEPFANPKHNIDPMKYSLQLSAFHSLYYNFETDRLLMRFSKQILSHEWERFSHWLVGGSFYGIRLYLESKAFWLTCFGFMAIVKLWYLLFAHGLNLARVRRWHQEVGILTLMAGSMFALGFIPLIVFNYPFPRLLDSIALYVLPVVTCLVLPPFWMKREKT